MATESCRHRASQWASRDVNSISSPHSLGRCRQKPWEQGQFSVATTEKKGEQGHEKAGRGLNVCTEILRVQQQQGDAESSLLRRDVLLERRTWAEVEWTQSGETGQMTSQLEDRTVRPANNQGERNWKGWFLLEVEGEPSEEAASPRDTPPE